MNLDEEADSLQNEILSLKAQLKAANQQLEQFKKQGLSIGTGSTSSSTSVGASSSSSGKALDLNHKEPGGHLTTGGSTGSSTSASSSTTSSTSFSETMKDNLPALMDIDTPSRQSHDDQKPSSSPDSAQSTSLGTTEDSAIASIKTETH